VLTQIEFLLFLSALGYLRIGDWLGFAAHGVKKDRNRAMER